MTHITPLRTTSVQVVRADSSDGRHLAEDMHGFECFIDAESQVEASIHLGLILEAEIDHEGRIVRGRAHTPR
jgi:hypothetical protein